MVTGVACLIIAVIVVRFSVASSAAADRAVLLIIWVGLFALFRDRTGRPLRRLAAGARG